MALTLGLTPGFFFLEHWGPEGVPTAQGCSGSGAVAPPSVRVWLPSGSKQGDVATDGFFLLDASTVLDPEPLVDTTQVSVTQLDGASVAGRLFTLKGEKQTYLAWQANAPLEVGTRLKVVVEGPTVPNTPVVPDQVVFEVTGAPAPLAAGTLSFDRWLDYRHGVGEKVTCNSPSFVNCSPTTLKIEMFAAEQSLPAVYGAWHPPHDLHGFTLWEVALAAKSSDLPAPATLVAVDPDYPPQFYPLVFGGAAASHCVTITVKDLRSGATTSAEQCAAPQAPAEGDLSRDFPLSSCDAPPSEALTEAWCEARSSTLPVCQPSVPGPNEPAEPTPSTPSPSEPEAPPASNAASGGSRTSSSCQVALVGASAAGGACTGFVMVAGLLTLLRRRREGTRS